VCDEHTTELSRDNEEDHGADLAEITGGARVLCAFDVVQAHTSVAEKNEFWWSLFGKAATRKFVNEEAEWHESHTTNFPNPCTEGL
jgi:hypothetical protein